jgi:transcriptional regulator with XRE-family HTH domain
MWLQALIVADILDRSIALQYVATPSPGRVVVSKKQQKAAGPTSAKKGGRSKKQQKAAGPTSAKKGGRGRAVADPWFGERLRSAREAENLSRQQLAQKVSLGATAIGNYEQNIRVPDIYTAQKLARALGLDLAFFESGASWLVMNPRLPAAYILERNLAAQQSLPAGELVRQFGRYLPLRLMSAALLECHLGEMPDQVRDAHREIWRQHKVELKKQQQQAVKEPRSTPFASLMGIMRVGDFRRILAMFPPYVTPACSPPEMLEYLCELRTYLVGGYHLLLVRDAFADEWWRNESLGPYEIIATVGTKLAIRRLTDEFEIAWSTDQLVIRRFNGILDRLYDTDNRTELEPSRLDECCDLLRKCLDQMPPHVRWTDPLKQERWQSILTAELNGGSCPWLRA